MPSAQPPATAFAEDRALLRRQLEDWHAARAKGTEPELDPLPLDLLNQVSAVDGPWPRWFELCRQVMQAEQANTADDGWGDSDANRLRRHITSEALHFPHPWEHRWGDPPADLRHQPLTPLRVARLAAVALRLGDAFSPEDLHRWRPVDLTEDLLCRALAAGSMDEPTLCFVQPMTNDWLEGGSHGFLTDLCLWRHDEARADGPWPQSAGQLLRAPPATVLPVDERWARGLQRVQALLDHVLEPGAPAVSWCVRPLKGYTARRQPWPLPAVTGSSASATLALGALWLLRLHLRTDTDELRELRAALCDIDRPDEVLVSAELGELPPAPGLPALGPIGGLVDKLAALLDVPHARQPRRQLFAVGQPGHTTGDHCRLVPDLSELVRQTVSATSRLSEKQRLLHGLLLTEPLDERALEPGLLSEVMRDKAQDLRGYLLGRYATHASGEHLTVGPRQPLHRHYVRLQLKDIEENQTASRDGKAAPQSRDQDSDGRHDLGQLLDDKDLRGRVDAWCIEAEPYAGKTTLLQEWEMRSARRALQRLHARAMDAPTPAAAASGPAPRDDDAIDVPVFLPVNRLAEALGKGKGKGKGKAKGKGKGDRQAALVQWVIESTRGLGLTADASAGGRALAAPNGYRLRLLFDALDELQVAGQAEREEIEDTLCAWLAQPAHRHLLAPVFTVRVQEKATVLATTAGGRPWRARRVALMDFRASDQRAYLFQRFRGDSLPPGTPWSPPEPGSTEAKLSEAIGLPIGADAPRDDDALNAQPRTPMAQFCASPGILAAQCTLAETWPEQRLPERRGPLFLALVWLQLHRRQWDEALKEPGLLSRELKQALKHIDRLSDWTLPERPGRLLEVLARAADVMQDDKNGRSTEMPWPALRQALKERLPELDEDWLDDVWLKAVRATGLAGTVFDDGKKKQERFRFVHPQFLELFAALGLQPERLAELKDLGPPTLSPAPGQPLLDHLAQKGSRLQLPQVTRHHERVVLAVSVARSDELNTWLRRLIPLNLPLAAQCAIDVKDQLEPDDAWPGDGLQGPDPVLQHIRRLLLLHSMDAGEAVRDKLRAAALIGDDTDNAALAEHMPGFDDEALNAHWREVWASKCRGEGVDIRERIQAGLLLGQLTDTLRFTLVEAKLPDGSVRRGIVPRLHQWALHGEPGRPALSFRVGTDPGSEVGDDNERPAWFPDLDPFGIARYPVTVGEWQWFMRQKDRREAPAYEPSAPWWQEAGAAAQTWLQEQIDENPDDGHRPWALDDEDYASPLQPMTTITWHEARAYAAWVEPLHRALERRGWDARRLKATEAWRSRVPTEVKWEAGVRGPTRAGQAPQHWAHQTTPTGHASATGGRTPDPGPLDINHYSTSYWTSSPIGCFSVGTTAAGVVDAEGQMWEWCANALSNELRKRGYRDAQAQTLADREVGPKEPEPVRVALRGGAFTDTAAQCRASYRLRNLLDGNFGVRLVRVWPPHSGH